MKTFILKHLVVPALTFLMPYFALFFCVVLPFLGVIMVWAWVEYLFKHN